jgi:FtsP/CotA-like multicopper oxidase with cupredoxin domain
MPVEEVAGVSEVLEVAEDGSLVLDLPLPEGDAVYLSRPHRSMPDLAGAPGVAFARVMAGPDGRRMVPHYRAVDVVSDNRLLPQAEWTSTHRFAAGCEDPVVTAQLWYRRLPGDLVRERGWRISDVAMTEAKSSPGPELVERVDPPSTGNTVEVELTAAEFDDHHYSYAYNGQHPGPEIRAQIGDVLRVTLHNELDDPTTIHWHGYKVPYDMDGVTWMRDPIMPGETFVYEFPLVHAGTFWYHPHFDTSRQVDGGLYGLLIVEDPAEPASDADLVLVLDAVDEVAEEHGDHEEDDESASEDHAHGLGEIAKEWTVNGMEAPLELELRGGTSTRVRVLNASNVAFAQLTSPQLRQIGADQGLLAAPSTPESVLLVPGDRAEFEWLPSQEGFSLWTQPHSLNGGPSVGEPVELVRVRIVDPAPAREPLAYEWSNRTPTQDPGHTDVVYALSGSDRYAGWLINGEAFPDVTVREVGLGTAPIVEVRNVSPTAHPFHMHGLVFEVLSINGVAPETQLFEDNLNVGVRDVVRLRVLADNPGDWMTHCHILPHAEQGMLTVFRVTE